MREKRLHHTPGSVVVMTHQVGRDLLAEHARPERRKRPDASSALDDGRGEPGDILRIEAAEREALLAHRARSQPIVGHFAEFVHSLAHLITRHHAKDTAILLEPSYELAVSCAAWAIERELPEIDARLLTDFHEGQTEVGIVTEVLCADFVEDRRPAIVVATGDKKPDQLGHAFGRADRIPERHPRPPLHAVH